jgi:hypothetical protein
MNEWEVKSQGNVYIADWELEWRFSGEMPPREKNGQTSHCARPY